MESYAQSREGVGDVRTVIRIKGDPKDVSPRLAVAISQFATEIDQGWIRSTCGQGHCSSANREREPMRGGIHADWSRGAVYDCSGAIAVIELAESSIAGGVYPSALGNV